MSTYLNFLSSALLWMEILNLLTGTFHHQ